MTTGGPFAEIARALARARLPHALIGGHAVNAWAEPRFTADIDLTVVAQAEAIARFRVELEAIGYRVTGEVGRELPSGPDFVRFARAAEDPPLDVQVAKTRFQEEVVRRARVAGDGLCIATAEDLVVLKLIANRVKDQLDLHNLLALDALDWAYVDKWAVEWGVADRLERLRMASS